MSPFKQNHAYKMVQEQHAIYFGYAFFRRFRQILQLENKVDELQTLVSILSSYLNSSGASNLVARGWCLVFALTLFYFVRDRKII